MRYEVLIGVYIKIVVLCDVTQNKIRQTPASVYKQYAASVF
jgi:hypothetical protein